MRLDPPINFRNWVSHVTLDHVLQWIQARKILAHTEMQGFLAFSSRNEVFGRQWQLQEQKVLQTLPKQNIHGIALTVCCCYKINWLEQLRGFILGIALKWIIPKLISGSLCYHLCMNSHNWISCTRLDHAFHLNKYGIWLAKHEECDVTDAYIALLQGGGKQLDIHCLYVCDHS